MKVFSFIKQSSAAKFIITDILNAFNRHGNEIMFIDFDLAVKKYKNSDPKLKYNKIAELIVSIKEYNPDIVLSYGIEIFSHIFEEIDKNLQITLYDYLKHKPVICFLFDFGQPFDENTDEIKCLELFQSHNVFFFVWDKQAIKIMNKCGVTNTGYFPMAVNEKIFSEDMSVSRDKTICFVGGPTPERIETLETISSCNPDIYGYGKEEWMKSSLLKKNYKYPVFAQNDLCKLYSQYKFSVNITRPHGFTSLNMRVYESIICGSIMITDDKADVYDLFIPDKEILIYKSRNELKSIIEKYLPDSGKLKEIKNNGISRILESHTYLKRISEINGTLSSLIFETELFNKLFVLYSNQDWENISSLINCTNPDRIKINKIYFLLFKVLTEKNKQVQDESVIKNCIEEIQKVTLKNKRINRMISNA